MDADGTGARQLTSNGVPGRRFPLVIQTHGGPQASDKFGFGASRNYTQVLTALGYVVLQPNYRGSTGYGDTFLRTWSEATSSTSTWTSLPARII